MIPYHQKSQLKVIDNFNISKINVKFEHQYIAPF